MPACQHDSARALANWSGSGGMRPIPAAQFVLGRIQCGEPPSPWSVTHAEPTAAARLSLFRLAENDGQN